MLSSLFLSKNEKLVKKWKLEHQEIGNLAGKIIESYENNNLEDTKKYLNSLKDLVVEHLMQEDLTFHNLLKHSTINIDTIEHIQDFRETFKGTKTALMNFIAKYASADTELDDKFLIAFKGLVRLVVERINYEESNLYDILAKEK
ncbi:hypothetical protein MNB_SV-9-987 [hydrothermal vent metagenome]|uniref:Hemerythrin-like domain-containing protein n=1 Tax=hydrothermal vent metagenome TaxID=652676 RepID=A0A1W1BL71_9ZZZZ